MRLLGNQKVNGRSAFWKVISVMCLNNFSLSEAWKCALPWADKKLKKISAAILNDLTTGRTLSDVAANYPKVFCEVEIKVVKSGETSHDLVRQLEVLSDMLYRVGEPPAAAYNIEAHKELVPFDHTNTDVSTEKSFTVATGIKPVMHFFYHVLERALIENVKEIRIIPEVNNMKVSYKTDKSIFIPENFSRLPRKIFDVMIVKIKEDLKQSEADERLEENEKILPILLNNVEHLFIVCLYPGQNGDIIVIKTMADKMSV